MRADFMAACLAVGADAAISHICAALLWGMLRIRIYQLLTVESLDEHLASAGDRAGTRRIKTLLDVAGRARNLLEDDAVARLPGTGIESNFVIGGDDVDLYDPATGTVLEIDSHEYHGNPIARLLDAKKTERLEAGGLTVLRAVLPPAPAAGSSSRGGRSAGRR